jgi:hypothetical protein
MLEIFLLYLNISCQIAFYNDMRNGTTTIFLENGYRLYKIVPVFNTVKYGNASKCFYRYSACCIRFPAIRRHVR